MSGASLHESGGPLDDTRNGQPDAAISMSASVDACASRPPGTLSCYVTTITAVAAAITFSASGAAPTPLYHEYQEHFSLTPFMITVIFAVYVLSLLLALLTVGSLSDYVGRRPAILSALMVNILAMLVFMTAGSAAALVVARTVQGFANGLAITTLAATILDTDKERAPLFNSVTVFAGLSAGTLGAGALVTFAPAPEQLVFVVLLVLSVVEGAILWFMPETATPEPGALASLLPHVHVPRVARATFAAIAPVTVASWSLGGFYFSLMPSVVRAATGATLPIIGGLVVAALTVSGAVAVVVLRNLLPERILMVGIITLTSRRAHNAGRRPVSERYCHAVRNGRRWDRLRHGLLRDSSDGARACPTRRACRRAIRLFCRRLSGLQRSCARRRLPSSGYRPHTDRRFLRCRCHPAGDQYPYRQHLAASAKLVDGPAEGAATHHARPDSQAYWFAGDRHRRAYNHRPRSKWRCAPA